MKPIWPKARLAGVKIITGLIILGSAALMLMMLPACASTNSVDTAPAPVVPHEAPGIHGVITSVDSTAGRQMILVEENPNDSAGSQKAAVRLTGQTQVYRRSGSSLEEIDRSGLTMGTSVSVWFEGPVAESYPVQGSASVVVCED